MSTILLEEIITAEAPPDRKTIFDYLEDPESAAVLPSLQSVVNDLGALTSQDNTRLDEITQLVRMDQSMSLHVLRIANSAYYGPVNPIVDIQAAILYIGLNTLRGAVASTRCMEQTCHIEQAIFKWPDFWIHAASVGQMTMELAARLKDPELPMESYYLMGLFHDIGKVVLACLMPDEFNDIYTRAIAEKKSPVTVEVETLGIEHGLLGAWYLEKQGVPLALREPVRFHHSGVLEDKPYFEHAALIRLADSLVLDFKIGQSGNHAKAGNPFFSDEWKWYTDNCDPDKADKTELRSLLVEQLAQTSVLVREMILHGSKRPTR